MTAALRDKIAFKQKLRERAVGSTAAAAAWAGAEAGAGAAVPALLPVVYYY